MQYSSISTLQKRISYVRFLSAFQDQCQPCRIVVNIVGSVSVMYMYNLNQPCKICVRTERFVLVLQDFCLLYVTCVSPVGFVTVLQDLYCQLDLGQPCRVCVSDVGSVSALYDLFQLCRISVSTVGFVLVLQDLCLLYIICVSPVGLLSVLQDICQSCRICVSFLEYVSVLLDLFSIRNLFQLKMTSQPAKQIQTCR